MNKSKNATWNNVGKNAVIV